MFGGFRTISDSLIFERKMVVSRLTKDDDVSSKVRINDERENDRDTGSL